MDLKRAFVLCFQFFILKNYMFVLFFKMFNLVEKIYIKIYIVLFLLKVFHDFCTLHLFCRFIMSLPFPIFFKNVYNFSHQFVITCMRAILKGSNHVI